MSGALREIKKEARGKKREAGRCEVEKNREEEEEEDVNSPRPVQMTQSDHFLFGRCCRCDFNR